MNKEQYKKDIEFLIEDEEEAIKGYDKVIEQMDENNPLKSQLKKIREEEIAHRDFLKKALDDENAKYVDPSDSEPDNNDGNSEERKAASILFNINLDGGK